MYENKEWVEYLSDRIPVKRSGRPDDLDSAVVFRGGEQPVCHWTDPAGGWWDFNRRGTGTTARTRVDARLAHVGAM